MSTTFKGERNLKSIKQIHFHLWKIIIVTNGCTTLIPNEKPNDYPKKQADGPRVIVPSTQLPFPLFFKNGSIFFSPLVHPKQTQEVTKPVANPRNSLAIYFFFSLNHQANGFFSLFF